jgi:hypothetical protein
MFDDHAHAMQAVRDLESGGFTSDEVSIVGGQRSDAASGSTDNTEADTGAGTGATLGTVLGGGAGLLAGLGALAIPGIGPLVAAGWLVAAVTGAGAGAAAGSLMGALVGSGVDEKDADVYAEGVRRGGTLVSVRADEGRLQQAEAILARHQTVDVSTRGDEYRAGGWSGRGEDASLLSDAPDGTRDNPSGTMASRGADRALGTNMSGAYPNQSDGTAANPAGTAAGRAASRVDDDGSVIPRTPDGTPGNPPGTKLSRGIDEVAGTNVSGAHPENETVRRR